MKFDFVCFGALNVDRLYKVDHIAKAEEESEILAFKESAGGSAANAAVGLARLGAKTGFVGKVAAGRDGEFLLDAFTQEGVNTKGIIVSETGRSGTVIGFVDQRGERALYLDPGVNNSLAFDEISLEYVAGADFLHLTSFAAKAPFEAQKKLVEALPDIAVTFDPGALYARKGLTELKPLIQRCFAVLPNEHELKILTGKDCKEGAEFLLREGVKIVAVKLGRRGCYVTDGEESHLLEPYKVKAVDSTGAGDAFCAGFLYGLLKGKTLKECGTLGNFVASRTITKMGARNGLPRKEDLPFLEP
ncbi:MAG: carbohydrate kinase family protein [Candidatus Bathyarchaeota archaeon]|nr:carbohydrate kinase family protein [Candidatus Bathyarchaeota archaeon]